MKRSLATVLAVLTLLTVLYVPASAKETVIDDDTLRVEATALLSDLLEQQYKANETGTLIDTSEILSNTPGTEL